MAKTSSSQIGNANQRIDNLERRIKALEKAIQLSSNDKSSAALANSTKPSSVTIEIPIQLSKSASIPQYANITDVGFDIRADRDYYISPGCTVLIKTGLRMAIPVGYELQIRPRSGISLNTELRVSNSPGTVDPAYLDEICVLLSNTYRFKNINARVVDIKGNKIEKPPKGYPKLTVFVRKGDRIAQGVINKICQAKFLEVDDVTKYSANRGGGFGSTGVR